jgi:hypothetical protein
VRVRVALAPCVGVATVLLSPLALCPTAVAEDSSSNRRVRLDVGVGTWISVGDTTWSHDASSQSPLGNPTSKLTYSDHSTNVVEITAKVSVGPRWFGRLNVGGAGIGGGRLTDDDFLAPDGGNPSLRTQSDIDGANMWYVNADVGARIVNFPNGRGNLDGFVGMQYWRQQHQAYGVRQVICSNAGATVDTDPTTPLLEVLCIPGASPISNTELVITNVSSWYSIRTGVQTEYRLTRWLAVVATAVVKPVSVIQNNDTHHLRVANGELQDPSFSMLGIGFGADAEIGAKVSFSRALSGYVGYRVFWNRLIDGTWENHLADGRSFSFPLTQFQSLRHGLTAGITYSF